MGLIGTVFLEKDSWLTLCVNVKVDHASMCVLSLSYDTTTSMTVSGPWLFIAPLGHQFWSYASLLDLDPPSLSFWKLALPSHPVAHWIMPICCLAKNHPTVSYLTGNCGFLRRKLSPSSHNWTNCGDWDLAGLGCMCSGLLADLEIRTQSCGSNVDKSTKTGVTGPSGFECSPDLLETSTVHVKQHDPFVACNESELKVGQESTANQTQPQHRRSWSWLFRALKCSNTAILFKGNLL